MMSPSTYILTLPAGIIAFSMWIVRKEDTTHRISNHNHTKQIARSRPDPTAKTLPVNQLDASARLDHERYGWSRNPAAQGATLGRNVVFRPVGERASAAPDWLSYHQTKQTALAREKKYSDISTFEETSSQPDPLAAPLDASAGYQITAEEVTQLDSRTGKVIFNKNVHLTSPQFNLESDQLVVFLGKDKNTMRLMEAHGNVNVLLTGVPPEKTYRGQSRNATYDPLKDAIVLSGWPKVKGQSQEQVAASENTRMTLFTKSGRMQTEGRAQTRITKAFMAEATGAEN